MSKEKKYNQSKIFEFKPKETVTQEEINELLELIRIGVGGELLDKASPELKKHFKEVKDKKAA